MDIAAKVVIGIVALEHLYILWMEMFAWETVGKRTFKAIPRNIFKETKSLAANQGLYNGFLAAGLIWSLLITDPAWQDHIALFFLGCVFIAGTFAALTAAKKIFIIQALPALTGIVLVILSAL